MNTEKYLARIGLENPVAIADIYNLRLLQRQHLLNVPFENLDIHWRRPIVLDTEYFYRKIVEQNRGGFCYELNGLFNELLRESGFETRLLSARVSDGRGSFSDEFDHLAILVMIGEMQFLCGRRIRCLYRRASAVCARHRTTGRRRHVRHPAA